jgi:uncharacterized protein (DUF924 family)
MRPPRDVLQFWFGEPARDLDGLRAKVRRWFVGGPDMDHAVRNEFGAEIEAALAGRLDAWLGEPKGWLALILVLDQLTRNAYRDEPKMYAGDARAVELTLGALADRRVRALPLEERHFALMPLLHAEDTACQARFAEEVDAHIADTPDALKPFFASALEQSRKYSEIIRRFGRFPHRNAILGRRSTPEEEAFLVDWAQKARPSAS